MPRCLDGNALSIIGIALSIIGIVISFIALIFDIYTNNKVNKLSKEEAYRYIVDTIHDNKINDNMLLLLSHLDLMIYNLEKMSVNEYSNKLELIDSYLAFNIRELRCRNIQILREIVYRINDNNIHYTKDEISVINEMIHRINMNDLIYTMYEYDGTYIERSSKLREIRDVIVSPIKFKNKYLLNFDNILYIMANRGMQNLIYKEHIDNYSDSFNYMIYTYEECSSIQCAEYFNKLESDLGSNLTSALNKCIRNLINKIGNKNDLRDYVEYLK